MKHTWPMKLLSGLSGGTPPGGAIICGRLEGMLLTVGLGVGIVEASTMMLVPTMSEVALSVAVGVREKTGGALLVVVGRAGIVIEAEPLVDVGLGVSEVGGGVDTTTDDGATEPVLKNEVGASLRVALPALEGFRVVAAVEEGDEGPSEAGTVRDWLPDEVGTGDADVPIEPVPEGVIPKLAEPEGRAVPEDAEGVMLAVSEAVGPTLEERASEAGTPDEDTTSEVGVGTAPDGKSPEEGRTPDDGRIPDEIGRPDDGRTPEDSKLEGKTVGMIIGPVPVGRAEFRSDRMLDIALGTTETGRSETAEDNSEESAGGRMPDALAEATEVGAVDATPLPVGRTPDMTDDTSPGRSRIGELVATVSEVGMAPELKREVGVAVEAAESPVPKAVVMPMTMPDDGKRGAPVEAT